MSEAFAAGAARLAGHVGAVFGWRPSEFWSATPDELAALFAALAPGSAEPVRPADIARLKEQFPDG